MPVGRKRVRSASGVKNKERGNEWREKERERSEKGLREIFEEWGEKGM